MSSTSNFFAAIAAIWSNMRPQVINITTVYVFRLRHWLTDQGFIAVHETVHLVKFIGKGCYLALQDIKCWSIHSGFIWSTWSYNNRTNLYNFQFVLMLACFSPQPKAGLVTFVDEKQLIRITDRIASRHLFPVNQNLLYFILFYFWHTFPLSVWRPYCQVTPRVRRCVVRNFWPWHNILSQACEKHIQTRFYL